MFTLFGKCPTCGYENEFEIPTNAEQLAIFEEDIENGVDSGNMPSIIDDFRNRNQDAPCPESLENPIKCENCEDYYTIKDAKNWNELKSQLQL